MRTTGPTRQMPWRRGVMLFSAGCNGGFTMVEMLAVLMILTILVALAVGVGEHIMDEAKREQTIAAQRVVMEAIKAYHDNYHDGEKKYPDEQDVGDGSTDELMNALVGDEDANVLINGLDSKAYAGGTDSSLLDAYGKEMWYRKAKGLGGVPVLISAGKDSEFGFGADLEPGGGDDDPDKSKDNIRSDGR